MSSSFVRTASVPISSIPGSLPVASILPDIDHAAIAAASLKALSSLCRENITREIIWRDQWALTGTGRTFFGPEQVLAAWKHLIAQRKAVNFSPSPGTSQIMMIPPKSSWIQAGFTFELNNEPACFCSGFVGLIPGEDGEWNIWMLTTILEQIQGLPNPDILSPVSDTTANSHKSYVNGTLNEYNFDCVVVGGGMAGLSTAGRLKAMNVNAVTLERNPDIGDNWLMRYDSTKLHTSRDNSHLPFSRTFPAEDGYFLASRKIAQGFQRYVKEYGINVWCSSDLTSASWNIDKGMWTLHLQRQNPLSTVLIHTPHVVLCLGAGGQVPKIPKIPNREVFNGIVMHSKDYKSPAEWKGKKGVVIGSANTAHDIASDMVNYDLKTVTMVQRNATAVIPAETLNDVQDKIYNDFVPVEIADRIMFGLPLAISRLMLMNIIRNEVDTHAERYDALERAGFKLDRYSDPYHFVSVRLGGHHLDVGAGKKIVSGQITVKSDAEIKGFTETGLEFIDGSHLNAEVIVFCTGFEGNMRESAERIFGPEIANGLEDFWGVDAEGEIIGAWKRQGYPGIWYHGGTIVHARYFSRFLALQVKADLTGKSLPLYETTHR